MTLAELIAPGSGLVRLHFPHETTSVAYGALWKTGEAMARMRAVTDGQPVAILLSNTQACATVLVGAIAAGQPLVSVPLPPRGANLEWYAEFVQRICTASGANTMLLEASLQRLIPPMDDVTVLSFDEALALRGPGVTEPGSFTLTQFTSGSTADPKGIFLSGDNVTTNLRALLGWLQMGPGDGICSWLPLSHDMGLIGTFLGALAGAGDDWARGMDVVIMTPQMFLRNPGSWLAACEEFKSTITAAPNYAYEMAARRHSSEYDLRRMRSWIVGAEPIRPASLERFAREYSDSGLNPKALCPAYGMAEMALVVTGTPPRSGCRTADIRQIAMDLPDDIAAAQGHIVASSGVPVPGFEVRIDGTGVGEILVKGPSIGARIDGSSLADADGWFHTRDIGILHDGELYVLGRIDDVFHVAGRNIYAFDVEAYAGEVPGVRPGRIVAIAEDGVFTLVAECDSTIQDRAAVTRLAQELKHQVVTRVGASPRRVLITERGALPLTASGKIRRKPLAAALRESQLKILAGSLD
ncbi:MULTISPECIES: AMP-binding protein [unclassified Nonomuraea]|uniref:AMP-binding protein n=1 Tax=unclassified Nonomuraea TaxID=2593643 RepID=UPI00137871E8|nr:MULTISPECIES: AMP-binding protein [unclassified Nonomuraea]NBE92574.1 AMP-binding protein [Nonomuraea sp. K271]